MILTINGQQAALKKGSSIEYVSENRIFTDADDYSMEIELPLADCPQNLDIFGMITRKDVDAGDIFFDAVLQDTNFFKRGAVVITGITNESVKVQFLERRSYQNFFPRFDEDCCYCLNMRSMVRLSSRSLMVWRLSYCFLPRPMAMTSLAKPRSLMKRRSGTMAKPG